MKHLKRFENIEQEDPWAEEHRLISVPKRKLVTIDNLPKIGDKVKCSPGFSGGNGSHGDYTYGGGGYKSDKIFIVGKISTDYDRPVIWPNDGGSGVYYNALEYVLE